MLTFDDEEFVSPKSTESSLEDGDRCTVIAGVHKGKSGVVRDVHTSKGGNVTITVVQANGERFKTLARNAQRGVG